MNAISVSTGLAAVLEEIGNIHEVANQITCDEAEGVFVKGAIVGYGVFWRWKVEEGQLDAMKRKRTGGWAVNTMERIETLMGT